MMKLKTILLGISLLLIMSQSFAQDYDTISMKEDFDFYSENLVFNGYKFCTIHPDKDWNIFGDAISKIIDGYIDMYLATKDKAYLYKVVHQSMCIIENRNDINPEASTKTPKWTETEMSTYTDGYTIGALSRFIYLVRVMEPALMNEPLYQFDEINPENYSPSTCNCNFTKKNFLTFGEYADWLEKRTRETLDYFVYGGLWSYEKGMLQPTGTLVINMQTGFARSLLYLGLSTDNKEYLRMADTIAALHKKPVRFNDACTKRRYNAPVLRLNQDKNSYWWYHSGWSISYRECFRSLFIKEPNFNAYTQYIEDVNHGMMVMLFPYEYYKYRNGTIFTQIDMLRFRNTFVNNLYDNGRYNLGVDGSNGTTYPEARYDLEQLKTIKLTGAISFASWSDFDSIAPAKSPKAYDIIMNDYLKLFYNKSKVDSYYKGQKCFGHAQLVYQQWQREKVSLTLFNRDMVYNQDFTVLGSITIDPTTNRNAINTTKKPFAHPKEFTDGGAPARFVIEPDVEVQLNAGESIRIKEGFYVKKGAKFKASISTEGEK